MKLFELVVFGAGTQNLESDTHAYRGGRGSHTLTLTWMLDTRRESRDALMNRGLEETPRGWLTYGATSPSCHTPVSTEAALL